MKRITLKKAGILACAAVFGLAAVGAVATSASAATVGSTVVSFSANDIEFSATSNDGSLIAYSSYSSDEIILLDTATGTTQVVSDTNSNINQPGGLVFSPDDSTLYLANYNASNGFLVVIDVASASVVDTSSSFSSPGPWTMASSPDGNYLYMGDYNANTFVTYDINGDSWNSEGSNSYPYALFISPDGNTAYNFDYYGQIDVFDVSDPMNPVLSNSWTNLTGDFYGACVNSTVTTLYAPDYGLAGLYAVSLVDGSVVEQNLATNPNNVYQYSCAVSPDDSSVFVTDNGSGDQDAAGDPVIAGGFVTEYNASTLEQIAQHDFSGVAYTQMINFFDVCDAFVAGSYGNAQQLTLDTGMCAPAQPSLPDTGVSPTFIVSLSSIGGALLMIGVVSLVVLRRRQA